MTTTAESLDWVTFSTGDDETCDGRAGQECPLEAVALAFWRRGCRCRGDVTRLCAEHRDTVLADWHMSRGRFECFWCGAKNWLLRVEPIR